MTRDEIIKIAKQAGFLDLDSLSRKIHDGFYHGFSRDERIHICNDERIERFANMVAAAEREACAKACDHTHSTAKMYTEVADVCAKRIRARGNATN